MTEERIAQLIAEAEARGRAAALADRPTGPAVGTIAVEWAPTEKGHLSVILAETVQTERGVMTQRWQRATVKRSSVGAMVDALTKAAAAYDAMPDDAFESACAAAGERAKAFKARRGTAPSGPASGRQRL